MRRSEWDLAAEAGALCSSSSLATVVVFVLAPGKPVLGYSRVVSLVCREQLAESILHEGSTGCRVVEKFLKILQVVVQEPGQVFKPFLPSIVSLCMEQVYPIIAEVGGGARRLGGDRLKCQGTWFVF